MPGFNLSTVCTTVAGAGTGPGGSGSAPPAVHLPVQDGGDSEELMADPDIHAAVDPDFAPHRTVG